MVADHTSHHQPLPSACHLLSPAACLPRLRKKYCPITTTSSHPPHSDLMHAPHTARCALTRRHTTHSRSRIMIASAERLDTSQTVGTPINVCNDVDVRCLHGKPRHFGGCGLAHSKEFGSERGDESLCSVRLGSARCRLVPARNDTAAARCFLGRALRVLCMDRIRLVVHDNPFAQITP